MPPFRVYPKEEKMTCNTCGNLLMYYDGHLLCNICNIIPKEFMNNQNSTYYPDWVNQFEKEYPTLAEEFKRIQKEQYELFAKKNMSYGLGNIALGTQLDTEEEKQASTTGIFIRCWDKMNRLKNLVLLKQANPLSDESIEDTWKDLSVYGIIAQIVKNGKWKK